MGLQSAMTTALSGLQAAETTIDVVGNNVANSNTVGFKESSVNFATQFLRTQSVGGGPTENSGGTNPRQVGLGVKVAEITPDFTQGTIEISSNPLDVAIQGDGFLMVQGEQGQLYTRNGQLKTNADNEIVTVTGHRLLGFGVNDKNEIQEGSLTTLTIPFGATATAQATQNASLTGNLQPNGTIADQPGVLESVILSRNDVAIPEDFDVNTIQQLQAPQISAVTTTVTGGGAGAIEPATYSYKFVFTDPNAEVGSNEGVPSVATATVETNDGAGSDIVINGIPVPGAPLTETNVYRADSATGEYRLVGTIPAGASDQTTFIDTLATGSLGDELNTDDLDQVNYSYFITYYRSGDGFESRPTSQSINIPITNDNRRIILQDLPGKDQIADGNPDQFDRIRIFRNVANRADSYYEVANLDMPETGTFSYIDSSTDSVLTEAADMANGDKELDRNGPIVANSTELINLSSFDGSKYADLFQEGTLSFAGKRGTANLGAKELTITDSTTVNDLIIFMEEALGIHKANDSNGIPTSFGEPGGEVNAESRLEFTSNLGLTNALDISLSAFKLTPNVSNGLPETIPITFSQTQEANGESTAVEYVVYDSLGSPMTVKMNMVLESNTTNSTTYRWFANSADNQPGDGVSTTLGTGLVTFGPQGQFSGATDPRAQLDRRDVAANSPVEFDIDFSAITAVDNPSNLNLTNQDGFSAGSLTSFSITESGRIKGVYSNGTTRDIGQIQMARFTNNAGLEQLGDNLFAEGVNSGEPFTGDPGASGLGSLTAGAVELSNTDIGQNLIELILASTQYRGNARVISAAQDLLDELMNLR